MQAMQEKLQRRDEIQEQVHGLFKSNLLVVNENGEAGINPQLISQPYDQVQQNSPQQQYDA